MSDELSMLLAAAQPRYLRLAQSLLGDIRNGAYPVGTLLPTESELCEKAEVSRHTVREAIRMLFDMGLVSRQPGVGTRVKASSPPSRYVQISGSIADLQNYVRDTRIEIREKRQVVADEALAGVLECRPGQQWLHMRAVRYVAEEESAIARVDIYIDPAHRDIVKNIGVLKVPIYTLIEQKYGERIVEVRQEISAVAISADDAKVLNVKSKSPGLMVTRRYFAADGRLLEVAVNLHPAGRFSYSTTLRMEEWTGRASQYYEFAKRVNSPWLDKALP